MKHLFAILNRMTVIYHKHDNSKTRRKSLREETFLDVPVYRILEWKMDIMLNHASVCYVTASFAVVLFCACVYRVVFLSLSILGSMYRQKELFCRISVYMCMIPSPAVIGPVYRLSWSPVAFKRKSINE